MLFFMIVPSLKFKFIANTPFSHSKFVIPTISHIRTLSYLKLKSRKISHKNIQIMSSNNRLLIAAFLLIVYFLFVNQSECRQAWGRKYNRMMKTENDLTQDLGDDGLAQQENQENGMYTEETRGIPVLIQVPDGALNRGESPETDQNTDKDQAPNSSEFAGVDKTEMALAESGPMAQYHNGPMADLRASASHHHHGHGVKGWLDMGAWTGKKGAFGWYDKHPVGKGK